MYIHKILSKPEFYYIPFPQKTDEVYFQINLKSGYAQEKDQELGIGHLLEHYLLGLISSQNEKLQCNGKIRQEGTEYYLKSTKSQILKEIQIFLDCLLSPNFKETKIFESEKERILNEVKARIVSLGIKMEILLMKNRFNKNCPYRRTILDELKNLEKAKFKDLKKYHQKFFNYGNLIFTIGGYKLEKKLLNKSVELIRKYKLNPENSIRYEFSCEYSSFKIIKQKEESLEDNVFIVISFPAFSVKTNTFQKRVELDFLGKLLSVSDYGILNNEIKKAGIYSLEYESFLGRNYGIASLGTIIPLNKLNVLLEILMNYIKKVKRGEIPKENLEKFIKNFKKSSKEIFKDNIKRFDWLIYDLIYYGKIIPPEEESKIIKKINLKTIKDLAREIFNLRYLNLFMLMKEPDKMNVNKIKKIIMQPSNFYF